MTLSNPVATGAVSVAWSVGTSTATSGSDYTALTPGTLTFPAGSTTAQTISVTVLDDDVVEASETLVLGIAASGTLPADVSVGTAEATLTINDADAATVSIAAPAAVSDPSGSGTTLTAVDFTVTLSNPVATGAVSVAWSVGTSTATSGSDYTALTPGTLTFPAGSTTAQTISVTVLDDNVVEASETLVLGIAASGTLPADVSVGTAEATLTINDADAATVSIAAPAAVTDPSGSGTTLTAVNFTVTLSNPVATGAVSVAWSVGTSTATSGSDYTALTPGTLTFPAGSTTAQTISVTVLDDNVVEASETLVLGIAASGTLPADVSVGTAEATLTIDDADAATVSIAAPAAVTDPSGSGTTLTAVNFTVTLSNPVATGAVSVAWSVGTSTATSGSDYTALTPGTLTFPAGSTTAQTISVTVLDDNVVEASETLVLGIAASGTLPADVSVGTAEATLTINDADAATVSIAAPAAVTDPSGSGTTLTAVNFTVTLSNPVATGAVSVAWSVGTSTATSGSDYTALTPGTLTFPAGSTTAQTISVTVLDDNVVEASETLVLGIAASGTLPADVSVGTAEATLTINDADAATVSIAAPAAVTDPSGSGTTLTAVNFTVTLSNPVATGAVSVAWSVGTSTATSGSDYTALTPGTLTFPAGSTTAQTISVTVLDDNVVEASETLVLGIAASGTLPADVSVGTAEATLTIDDADAATVSIAAPAAVTDPSGSGTTLTAVNFTVTLSNPVATGAVSVGRWGPRRGDLDGDGEHDGADDRAATTRR